MKDKVYKRAVFFMCAMIIISVLYGGARSVSAYRASVVDEYYEEGDQSASFAVGKIIANAQNLSSVAARYLENDAALSEFGQSLERFEKSGNINVESERLALVFSAAAEVYERLGECDLTDADKTYRTELYYNMKSYSSVLCHNEYNESAAEFNKVLNTPPASVFAGVLRLRELPVFTEVEE